jgi:two-component system sensor histidine kinase RpfC
MNTDIVEGALDKSEAGLRRVLATQARVRVLVAVPVGVTEAILYVTSPDSVPSRMVALSTVYFLYVLLAWLLGRFSPAVPSRSLLAATAVLDPLALSAWVVVTGEYGALMTAFYLFTILGFGFRVGRPLMYLCQVTAIAGFAMAFLSVPYWQERPVTWSALLLPLIVVPLYAGTLIKRLRESRELAERESQAKSELLAKVSHELRTPLAGIISAAELLASEAGQDVVSRRTDTILALANELLQEINDLLDEAKYGAGAVELSTSPVDLQDQLGLVRDALGATAAKKGIELRLHLDEAIAGRVETDAHLLGRVLLNLASNAVKFTDRGSVRLDVTLAGEAPGHYRVRFEVADTGIGIPEAFRARMFQPFSQVDQGASRKYGGTGLGLTLSKKIVELMGGKLEFTSEERRGSRFWFELDFARSHGAVAAKPAAQAALPVAPMRIMVAEDNETNLLLLQELLEKDGHQVATAASGMAALDLLAQRDFDLLLLDYNLGDMDGVRVLQTYRFGRRVTAPTLFLTADTTQLTAARLKEADGAGVLYKPITLAKLRTALRDVARTAGATAGGADATAHEAAEPAEVARAGRPQLAAVTINALDEGVIGELRTVSSRAEFFPRLMGEAENDMVRNCQLIIEALAQDGHAPVRDFAHALKGVSANVGAVRLQALAAKLMTSPRDEIDGARERWIADLRDTLRLTVAAMRKEVASAAEAASGGGPASLHLK